MKTKPNHNGFLREIKALIAILAISFGIVASASAQKWPEDLKSAYEYEGDSLFETFYFLPETRDTVLKHVPNRVGWVGIEMHEWKKVPEETKALLLDDLITKIEKLKKDQQRAEMKRFRDLRMLEAQINLMTNQLDRESFLDLAHQVPLLKPVFKAAIDRRLAASPDFNTDYIGSSLSSGEVTEIIPQLAAKLLEVPDAERCRCFSLLFARMAEVAAEREKK